MNQQGHYSTSGSDWGAAIKAQDRPSASDRAHALEVRRLKFLTKVYLACRLSTDRSLAFKSLKPKDCWPELGANVVIAERRIDEQTRQRIDSFPRTITIG